MFYPLGKKNSEKPYGEYTPPPPPPPLYVRGLRRQFSKSLKIQSDFLFNLKIKYRGLKTENKPWRKDVC